MEGSQKNPFFYVILKYFLTPSALALLPYLFCIF